MPKPIATGSTLVSTVDWFRMGMADDDPVRTVSKDALLWLEPDGDKSSAGGGGD